MPEERDKIVDCQERKYEPRILYPENLIFKYNIYLDNSGTTAPIKTSQGIYQRTSFRQRKLLDTRWYRHWWLD